MRYRKKPVVIEAIKWRPNEMLLADLLQFAGGLDGMGAQSIKRGKDNVWIVTLEGDMKISDGDYLIKGVKGELYPCKPDIFEATYEAVEFGDIEHGTVDVDNVLKMAPSYRYEAVEE